MQIYYEDIFWIAVVIIVIAVIFVISGSLSGCMSRVPYVP